MEIEGNTDYMTAEEMRELACELIDLANKEDDANGTCRCLGLEHRLECPEWRLPY